MSTLSVARRLAGVAVLLGLPFAEAAADDQSDCLGPDPAIGIPACTRLIGAPGAGAEAVADAYVGRAMHHIVQGDFDGALADLDAALARSPRHAAAHYNRGGVHGLQGRYDDALAALDEAIRLDPGTAESHHARGRIHFEVGDVDAAVADFDAALNVDAEHVDALLSQRPVAVGNNRSYFFAIILLSR